MASSDESLAQDNQGPLIITVSSVFVALATAATVARFVGRKMKGVHFGADDYVTIVALVFAWVIFAILVKSVQLGVGRHVQFVPPGNDSLILELLYVFQLFYSMGPMAVKVSLLLLYHRVFVSERFKRIIYITGAFVGAWIIAYVIININNCRPISAFWTREGWCIDFRTNAITYSTINIFTDLVVWFLPIPMVWTLHLSVMQKLGLSLIFLLGIFDFAIALIRLVLTMLTIDNPDFTWYDAPGYMWSVMEVSTGIVCSCLPTMRIVLLALTPSFVPRYATRLVSFVSSGRKSKSTSESGKMDNGSVEQMWPSTGSSVEMTTSRRSRESKGSKVYNSDFARPVTDSTGRHAGDRSASHADAV